MAHFEVYEHVLRLRSPDRVAVGNRVSHSKRGTINGFSAASRRRLRRTLAQVRWSRLPSPHFVTLTFHDVPHDWLARFRALLEWTRRRDMKYLWRLELQQRGAPHFHLILWCADLQIEAMRRHWHSVANPSSEAHAKYGFHHREIESYRAATAYLSKYMSKLDDAAYIATTALAGRRVWGASRGLPTSQVHSFDLTTRGYAVLARTARRLLRARRRSRTFGAHWGKLGIWLHVDPSTMAQLFRLVEPEIRTTRDRFTLADIPPDSRLWTARPPPDSRAEIPAPIQSELRLSARSIQHARALAN